MRKTENQSIIVKKVNYHSALNFLRNNIENCNNSIAKFAEERTFALSNEQIKGLLNKTLNIDEIVVGQNYDAYPIELRNIAKNGLRQALKDLRVQLNSFETNVLGTRTQKEFIEVKRGKLYEIKTVEKDFENLFTLKIDESDKIELYNRAEKLKNEIDELRKELNERLSNIFHFDFYNDFMEVNKETFANYSNYQS